MKYVRCKKTLLSQALRGIITTLAMAQPVTTQPTSATANPSAARAAFTEAPACIALVVVHEHAGDRAGHSAGEFREMALELGVVGLHQTPAGHEPGRAARQRHQPHQGKRPGTPARRRR
jgi:hypothetical protein